MTLNNDYIQENTVKLSLLSICAVVLFLFTSSHGYASYTEKNKIEGNVIYRERIAMPHNAKARIVLYGYRHGASHIVAEKYFSVQGRAVPFPFSLEYAESSGENADRYMLKAFIFTPDNQVFAASEPMRVDLPAAAPVTVVTRVGAGEPYAGEPEIREIDVPSLYEGQVSHNDALSKVILRLEHDHGFVLLRDFTLDGKEQSQVETGRWRQIANGHALILGGNGRAPLRVLVRPGNILEFADRPEQGGMNMELFPVPDGGPLPALRIFTGAFTYYEDCPTFTDCSNGISYRVSRDGDYAALEKSALAEKSKGKQLQVRFEGHMARDARSGKGMIVVDRFGGLAVDSACPKSGNMDELLNRHWKLLEINGKKALVFDNQTETHIMLQKEQDAYRLSGSDGCNRLVGTAKITEKDLQFGNLGSTMMLCPQGAEQSAEFTKTLSEVNGWRVFGDVLELLHNGNPRLAFESVLMD